MKSEETIDLILYGKAIKCASPNILTYNPHNDKIFYENYEIKKVIYSNGLSPSTISVAKNLKTDKMVAIKELRKDRLSKSYLAEFAKNELIIHYSLSKLSNNIVNVFDYFEDENSYRLAMEFCEEPNYFEDILENVIFKHSKLFKFQGIIHLYF